MTGQRSCWGECEVTISGREGDVGDSVDEGRLMEVSHVARMFAMLGFAGLLLGWVKRYWGPRLVVTVEVTVVACWQPD